MTVTCVDDPPVAVDDAATVAEDVRRDRDRRARQRHRHRRRPEDDRLGHRSPANGTVVDHRRRHRPDLPAGRRTTATTGRRRPTPSPTRSTAARPRPSRSTVTCVDDAPVAVDDARRSPRTPARPRSTCWPTTPTSTAARRRSPRSPSRPTAPWSITGGGTGAHLPAGRRTTATTAPARPTPSPTRSTAARRATVSVTVTCVDDAAGRGRRRGDRGRGRRRDRDRRARQRHRRRRRPEDDRLGRPQPANGTVVDHRRRHRPHLPAGRRTTATTAADRRHLHLHAERRLDRDRLGDRHLRRRRRRSRSTTPRRWPRTPARPRSTCWPTTPTSTAARRRSPRSPSRPTAPWSITGGGTGADLPAGRRTTATTGGAPDTFTYTLNGGSTGDRLGHGHLRRRPAGRGRRRGDGAEDSGATAIDVLANDTDIDGGPKTIASATEPANGTVVITGGGDRPRPTSRTPNYCNDRAGTDRHLHLHPQRRLDRHRLGHRHLRQRRPGRGGRLGVHVTEDTAKVFPASGAGSLKANDTDVDDRPAAVHQLGERPGQRHGCATADGSVTYTPDSNYNGPDSFTYSLCDPGQDGNAATPGTTSATPPPSR